ncbi:MAG: thioesterase family protein [Bacillota bacterium]
MDFDLNKGLSAKVEKTVTENDTARRFGSGGVDVYATPMMIGLMENAALKAVDHLLPEGYVTVGTSLTVDHLAATPVGMKVYAYAVLTGIEGKKLIFSVEAFDEVDKIGQGIHERYIVNLEKFSKKVLSKL